MSLKEQIHSAIDEAQKAGDIVTRTTLRMVTSAIKDAEIAAGRKEADDAGVVAILQKEGKARREALAEAEAAHRSDLAEAARAELGILEKFLPTQLSEEAIRQLVREAIAETGATSAKEAGNVMKALMPKVRGQANGKLVGSIVQELLQG